jgi:hypothetical protein
VVKKSSVLNKQGSLGLGGIKPVPGLGLRKEESSLSNEEPG